MKLGITSKLRLTRTVLPVLVLALLLLVGLSGCGSDSDAANTPAAGSSEASAPAEKVLLVVSFGTSYDDNRDLSIGGVEQALQTAFPDYQMRRAFTSQIIIDILAEQGTKIDNVTEAMDRLVADGVKDLVIQPTTIMDGFEYTDLVEEATAYEDEFDRFVIGAPLLISDEDFQAVADAITTKTADLATESTAIVYMGHGTEAPSNAVYDKLQQTLTDGGHTDYFVGTVEAEPTLEEVLAAVQAGNYTKVVLLPLMVVAGDHANNDMAGDEPDSWKSEFQAAGFEVETVLEGLGQDPEIQKIYVEHAKAALSEVE